MRAGKGCRYIAGSAGLAAVPGGVWRIAWQENGAPGVIRTRDPRIRSAKKPYTANKAVQRNPTKQRKIRLSCWLLLGRFVPGSGTIRAQFPRLIPHIVGARFFFSLKIV